MTNTMNTPEWTGDRAYAEGRAMYEAQNFGPGKPPASLFGDIGHHQQAFWIAKAARWNAIRTYGEACRGATLSAEQPLEVNLPERVIDQLFQQADIATHSPPTYRQLYDFAALVKYEVLARVPRAALAAPMPEQPPYGYLYDWTHSSALGRPDEDFTSFAKSLDEIRRSTTNRNIRAVYLAPTPEQPTEPVHFEGFLCQAWGETDLPCAEVVKDESGIRAFMIREWLGGEDAEDYDGTKTIDRVMYELGRRDWGEDGEWVNEFEIGGVSVRPVYSVESVPLPVGEQTLTDGEKMKARGEKASTTPRLGPGA